MGVFLGGLFVGVLLVCGVVMIVASLIGRSSGVELDDALDLGFDPRTSGGYVE